MPLTPVPPTGASSLAQSPVPCSFMVILAVRAPLFSVFFSSFQRAAGSVSPWPFVGVRPSPPPSRARSLFYSCTRTEVRSFARVSAPAAARRSAAKCHRLRGSKVVVSPIAASSLGPARTR